MELQFNDEEARDLLRLVYLGNWLANSQRIGSTEDPLIAEFDELQRKLFTAASVPERAVEDDALVERAIEEYRDEVFWDELVDRLAHRDFERLWGLCPDHDELSHDMEAEYEKIQMRYEMELEESGIDRLELLRTIDDVLGEEFPGADESRE
jgi:hypothetical protein